MMIFRECPTSG